MRRVVSGGFGVEGDAVQMTCRGEHGVRARVGEVPLRIRHSRFAALRYAVVWCDVLCYTTLCRAALRCAVLLCAALRCGCAAL